MLSLKTVILFAVIFLHDVTSNSMKIVVRISVNVKRNAGIFPPSIQRTSCGSSLSCLE